MKFRFPLLTILAATIAAPTQAETIDIEQAKQNAETFLCQASTSGQGRRLAPAQNQIRHVYTQNTSAGAPALYVFTTGGQGYVIASANDEAMTILGYSTEGTFDPENIPDGMKFMFDLYAEEIGSISTNATLAAGTSRKAPAKAQSTVGRIDPILGKIEWDQMPPYNLYCPVTIGGSSNGQYNGSRAATGCMTTALAQIMFHYKHPAHGYGSIEGEVKEGIKTSLWAIDLYNDYYNWDRMGNNKNQFATNGTSYNTNDPGVDGVAKLMRDLGLALRTTYGPASGASTSRLIPALVNYFDYDATTIQLVQRRIVGDEEFERQVLEELQTGRPIYLDGSPDATTGGHAFVCDGYDGNGFFHINWGWSGLSNDYFSLTGLDPKSQGTGSTGSGYNYGLCMLKGIQPRPEGQEPFKAYPISFDHVSTRPGTFSYPGIWVATSDDPQNDGGVEAFPLNDTDDFWFAAELGTPTGKNMDVRARYGVLVIRPNGARELVWDKNGDPTMLFSTFAYYKFHVNMKESWKQAGTRVYYIYQPCGETEPTLLRNNAGQVCCLNFVTQGDKLVAQIDRTEPSAPLDFTPTPVVQQEPYFTNTLAFDYDLDSPRTNRRIGTIGIQVAETNKSVAYTVDNQKMYRNMTDEAVFKVPAGSTIKPTITMAAGDWMHGYFYIDYNHDRNLTCNATSLSQEGTDLAAYSYWTGNVANGDNGYNSANQRVSNSNTLDMPAFQAPTTPGTYYVRFKVDWNCVEPGGNVGYTQNGVLKNTIVQNGGAIVDAKLIVTEPLPEPEPEAPELIAARAAYNKAEADYRAFREEAWNLTGEAYTVAQRAIQEIYYYVDWGDATIQQYTNATNIINTKLADARKQINTILGIEEPDTDATLVTARENYEAAVTAYNTFQTTYGNHANADVSSVASALAAALATNLHLGDGTTAEQYNTAATAILTQVAAARTQIDEILANAGGGEGGGEIVENKPVFPINFEFDKDAPRPTERKISSIGMQVNGENFTFNVDGSKMYRDMTKTAIFTVPAGATIKPTVAMNPGGWMHGYFYIDRNGDGTLSCNANQLSQEGTDVASYSFWSGNVNSGESGQNSEGTPISGPARNTLDMPAFQAPMTPGIYKVRYKIDWNCIDPAGNTTTDNSIIANGGAIVDAVLIVADGSTPEPEPEPEPEIPDASGNAKLSGIYISYGTSTSTVLQLYPEFDPDTHIYLARRLDTDIENPGSCWVGNYYTYSIWGTAQDSEATVSGPVTMTPRPNWNHIVLTCTAADKKTTEDYHIIMLSNSGGNSSTNTFTVSDLSLMIHLLGPDFGYTDKDFGKFINQTQLENLINQLLKK